MPRVYLVDAPLGSPRYAALGNAVNRVVAEWILCRLAAVGEGGQL